MNGWTAERHAQQADAIRKWRPWEHATGPRSAEGKARASRNAYRGGLRQTWRAVCKVLNAQLRELQEAARCLRNDAACLVPTLVAQRKRRPTGRR